MKRKNEAQPAKTEREDIRDATRHISEMTTLEIWVRSGGRCARCNTYLLEDGISERTLNLGERAHIVGWNITSGSPRGQTDLPLSERNKASNLMLLCPMCHKTIDDKETRGEYPVERLLAMKQEQEDRVFHLTGISPDMDTTVLRVFGAIRGTVPELAREVAMQTVVKGGGRYAKFLLLSETRGIELNLSSLDEPEEIPDGAYWKRGQKKIDVIAERIADAIHEKKVRHLSVFALARMPFLMYLGFRLDDKVPMDIYQKHRGADEGWLWPEDDAQSIGFKTLKLSEGTSPTDVTLVLSLSGTIGILELPAEMQGMTIYEIRPRDVTPNRDLIRSRVTLDAFTRAYHDLLATLETGSEKPKRIHLFPSVPITAAIACGRGIMRHVHPEVIVYDRIGEEFQPTITLNER